jgi:hypothetical protein
MLQKNVGGGRRVRVGGGARLGTRGQYWTSRKNFVCWNAHDGRFGGDCSLGEGVNVCLPCPPPPRRIARCSPKTRTRNRWQGSPDTPPLAARVPTPPPRTQLVKRTKILNGRTSRAFSTPVCDSTHLVVKLADVI